jgi:nicotinamidase-related amidase
MEAHICVLQTAMECQAAGFQVFVVEDGICSRRQDNKDNALHRLRQAGVVVTNTESVLFEWLRDAQHSEFRTLSKLII